MRYKCVQNNAFFTTTHGIMYRLCNAITVLDVRHNTRVLTTTHRGVI